MDSIINEDYEQTLALINTVHVFKIPPRQSSEGYKAEGWMENRVWTGRCRVVARGLVCEVKLENPADGKPFAVCVVNTSKTGPRAIEPVTDSTRYFVLRIEDRKQGRHAFIGIGFEERTDSFDFNVALQDHQKFVERSQNPAIDLDNEPKKDYSMKEGEKIKVNFKVKTKGKTTDTVSSSRSSSTNSPTPAFSSGAPGFGGLLPPPPSHKGGAAAPAAAGLRGDTGTRKPSSSNSSGFDF